MNFVSSNSEGPSTTSCTQDNPSLTVEIIYYIEYDIVEVEVTTIGLIAVILCYIKVLSEHANINIVIIGLSGCGIGIINRISSNKTNNPVGVNIVSTYYLITINSLNIANIVSRNSYLISFINNLASQSIDKSLFVIIGIRTWKLEQFILAISLVTISIPMPPLESYTEVCIATYRCLEIKADIVVVLISFTNF